MGNIIKKIKDKVSGWFGKKKTENWMKNFAGTTETPLLSNQYFNKAVSSYVKSFSVSPTSWTIKMNYWSEESLKQIALYLIFDKDNKPLLFTEQVGESAIEILISVVQNKIKCPKTLSLYRYVKEHQDELVYEIVVGEIDINYVATKFDRKPETPGTLYRMEMIGSNYNWSAKEIIDVPVKYDFGGYRIRKTKDGEFKEFENFLNDWKTKVGYGNLKP